MAGPVAPGQTRQVPAAPACPSHTTVHQPAVAGLGGSDQGTCGAGAGGSTLGGDPFSSFLTHRVGQWEKGPATRGSPQPGKPSPHPHRGPGASAGQNGSILRRAAAGRADSSPATPSPAVGSRPGGWPASPSPTALCAPAQLHEGSLRAPGWDGHGTCWSQSSCVTQPLQGAGGVPAPAQAGPSCPYLTSRMDGLVSMMATMILSM